MIQNIEKILQKLGFISTLANSGKNTIWTSPHNSDTWVALPNEITSENFGYYGNLLADVLLHELGIEDTSDNREDMLSQITGLNYKIFNRIELKSIEYAASVPYELANIVTIKSINGFRTYSHQFSKKLRDIPVESFQLNHSRKGSFVIPVSVLFDNETDVLTGFPNELNSLIRGYLEKIDLIKEIKLDDAENFAKTAFEREISAKLLEDVLGYKDSIASTISRYKESIQEVEVFSNGNPILDLGLTSEDRQYKKVELSGFSPVSREFIDYLVALETKENDTVLEEHGVSLSVEVDAINITGTAMFTVYGIGNTVQEKPFKAQTVKLSKERIDICADALKTRGKLNVRGDIKKEKRKVGEVVLDYIENDQSSNIGDLFSSADL